MHAKTGNPRSKRVWQLQAGKGKLRRRRRSRKMKRKRKQGKGIFDAIADFLELYINGQSVPESKLNTKAILKTFLIIVHNLVE